MTNCGPCGLQQTELPLPKLTYSHFRLSGPSDRFVHHLAGRHQIRRKRKGKKAVQTSDKSGILGVQGLDQLIGDVHRCVREQQSSLLLAEDKRIALFLALALNQGQGQMIERG